MSVPHRSELNSLFLSSCLLSGLGDFSGLFGLVDTLDDTYSNRLTHITDSESTERRIIGESFDAHGFGRNHLDNGSITRFDEFGCIFDPDISLVDRETYFLPERRSIFSKSSANLQAM
jgi:hypothetical protein